jgi:SAM-dependent methyltransferase
LEPAAAFDIIIDELAMALRRLRMQFEPAPNGRVTEDGTEVGRVVSWEPGRHVLLEWHAANWKPDEVVKVELRFKRVREQTRITLETSEWERVLGDHGSELAGWFAGEVMAPLLQAMGPGRFGDWVTDRAARRPSGALARSGYRDPVMHRPNFKAILRELSLTPKDYLLEIGCGGGAFLEDALRSGCRAAAVDHSPEMVRLAREVNKDAVANHRLEVLEAEADKVPYPDSVFTCAMMTNVFGFLRDPVATLAEVHRVLTKGGHLVIFTLSPEMRGTMAAPEPMASRLRFYEDVELVRLAKTVGFEDVRVERPSLEPFAREAGLPEEQVKHFAGPGDGQLLVAHKG